MDFIETVKIPKDRVAALIGKNGNSKKKIETLTSSKIDVDSKTGDVEVRAKEKESVNFYNAVNIVKAVGRGFSPENALLLLDTDYYLDILKLDDIVGKSLKAVEQKKGRIIGANGTARKTIEDKTDCTISVYGKTVSIIGKAEKMETARKAVEMLLQGASHDSVYNFLHRKMLEEREFRL